MSASADSNAGIHRLTDMVVEEVSLVDRAANKHRFLVVKRDEPMADKSKNSGAKSAVAPSPPQNEGAERMSKAIGDALGIATAALEALTGAIEQLGQVVGEADSSPIVAELAEQLSEAAGQLAASAGVQTTVPDTSEDVATVAVDVRSTLAQVSELLASVGAKEKPAAAEPPAPAPTADPPAANDEVSKQLGAVVASLRSLADSIKDQSQRLGRLEKGVGLPNSRQASEHTVRPESQEVSWPLDLNHPMDRENVDKSVSFHDR